MGSLESSDKGASNRLAAVSGRIEVSPEHYLQVLRHRKWVIVATLLVVSAATAIVAYRLPDVYESETLILVDPQQVPQDYVRATISGDVRNRLGTLSQQILSATRLQKVIDTFNLYAEERKKLVREDVITLMRAAINVKVVSDFGGKADLQAFRISYSSKDARIAAQVTNELASLFIGENLKAREQMASGTSSFMENQLGETKKQLEAQEAQVREFKMKHLGEMPEQQQSNIQILAQLQARLQVVSDSLYRAEQQKSYIQTILASRPLAPQRESNTPAALQPRVEKPLADQPTPSEGKLSELLTRYGENHPDVKRLKAQVEQERRERDEMLKKAGSSTPAPAPTPAGPSGADQDQTGASPTVQAQVASIEAEIAKNKQEQKKITEAISAYQVKMEAEPVREQQIADLVRDYGISKEHYSQLLEKKLSAEMATQLEIRQQGEKFTILDPAQVAQKPAKPNRLAIDGAGVAGGLVLGIMLALSTELLGASVISASEISTALGLPVLGVIPLIITPYDRQRRKRWMLAGVTSGVVMVLAVGAFLFFHYRDQIF